MTTLTHESIIHQPAIVESNPYVQRMNLWLREKAPWLLTSLLAHTVVLLCTWLILELLGFGIIHRQPVDAVSFEVVDAPAVTPMLEPLVLTNPPVEQSVIEVTQNDPIAFGTAQGLEFVAQPSNETSGPLGPQSFGPAYSTIVGFPGYDSTQPRVTNGFLPGKAASGGDGLLSRRGDPIGKLISGATQVTEQSVAGALNWLARHQNADGSWSLQGFSKQCRGAACGGAGTIDSDAAGTALGVLPFLGAGLTHEHGGPYQQNVSRAMQWLIGHQKPDGDLSAGAGGNSMLYSHGLATIALCESYAMTKDSRQRLAAEKAIHFIEDAQDKAGGGWRYKLNEAGDTSVVGWQIMALKSGVMAGIAVKAETLDGAKKYLAAFKKTSQYGGLFGYQPGGNPTTSMTGVGALCTQYLGAARGSPEITESARQLMANLPDGSQRDIYSWYYGTQVMHNMLGPDWDTWNRKLRKILVDQQVKGDTSARCDVGSWDPDRPTKDRWGDAGGRVMMTSMCALTLEVYYRYLPLYQLDR